MIAVRVRNIVTGCALATLIVVGVGGVARAQEGTSGASNSGATATETFNPNDLSSENKEIFECFEKESAKPVPDFVSCAKAPSPILPAKNELVWGTLSFVLLLVVMAKFGFPALRKGMEGRTERIRTDLARADEAKAEAEGVLAQYNQQLAVAKQEATRVIEDARATADALKADLHKRAEAEIAEMRQRAAADIESSKAQAIADLKGEVAALAIGAAEVVVQKNLDHATQVALVENYISTVGSKN